MVSVLLVNTGIFAQTQTVTGSGTLQDRPGIQQETDAENLAQTASSTKATRMPEAPAPQMNPTADIILVATTTVTNSVELALTNLGQAYDLVSTTDFTTLDFTPYSTLIVAMDGGSVSEASVQAIANAAASGKKLFILGGTNIQSYYDGVAMYLLSHTGDQGWTTSNTPHLQVTDPNHPLSTGLPSTYNFVNTSASFYMLRVNDPAAVVAANNGDGHPDLFNKTIGAGELIYFLNSPNSSYWTDANDFAILQQVITNGLNFGAPSITVTPGSFSVAIGPDATTSGILTIGNTGNSDLTFDIALFSAAAANAPRQDLTEIQDIPSGEVLIQTGSMGDAAADMEFPSPQMNPTADIVLVATTTVTNSVELALTNLGQAYDLVSTTDFTTIDFTPYSTLIVAMDGGSVSEASVQAIADAAATGKKLFIIGGTNTQSYYDGVAMYLLSHTGDQGWTTSNTPHLQVTDPSHPLSTGLPSTYNFVNTSASFYMLRVNDPAAVVAANNGDGHPDLFNKPIGSGELVYFLNSPFDSYWADANDFAILQQVIENGLNFTSLSWLSVNFTTGTVTPGGSFDVSVFFDATGLAAGDYFANINIASNDPLKPMLTIPVHLVVDPALAIEPVDETIPEAIELSRNYPNPFNPSTQIGFRIANLGFVELKIYDVLGSEITTLVQEDLAPGNYEVQWNGTNDAGQQVASGVYLYRLRVGNNFVQTRKMMLMK